MIFLGLTAEQKRAQIARLVHDIAPARVVVLHPKGVHTPVPDGPVSEHVQWDDIIRYVYFYRLMQEIDGRTLVVLDEMLAHHDRNSLTLNCVRHFLAQAGHVASFSWLPILSRKEDFLILFDLETRSKWKRAGWDDAPIGEAQAEVINRTPTLARTPVATSPALRRQYEAKRERLFEELGDKDPHTIPRTLHLLGGKAKKAALPDEAVGVARNRRLGDGVATYKDPPPAGAPCALVDVPHDLGVLARFCRDVELAGDVPVMSTDLKVDHWYWGRCEEWMEASHAVCAALSR